MIYVWLDSWEWGGADFQDGTPSIGTFGTHYALMNLQEGMLNRKLPIQLVVYHIHMQILHSGLTPQEVLALDTVSFGKFIAQALQPTRDPGWTPYERDFSVGMMCTMSGRLSLGVRDTENMVCTPFHSRVSPDILSFFVGFDRGFPVESMNFLGALFAHWYL